MRPLDQVQRGLIIDTGALFCALVLQYLQVSQIASQQEKRLIERTIPPEYRWQPRFAQEYLGILTRSRPLMTTAHAVGELQGLARSRAEFKGDQFRFFWQSSAQFFSENITEEVVHFQDIANDRRLYETLLEIGPTDTAMIALALRKRAPVLTIDSRTLAKHAKVFIVECLFPGDIL